MYGTWLIGYLEMQHHVSIAKTGFLAMIPLFCSIVGSQVGGYATDRLAHGGMSIVASRKIPAVAGYIASAFFCALAALCTQMPPALAAISAAMFSLSFAQSGKWTLITAVAPQSYSASVASIQNFGSYIGGTVSPLLTGFVVDQTGSFVLALGIGAGRNLSRRRTLRLHRPRSDCAGRPRTRSARARRQGRRMKGSQDER